MAEDLNPQPDPTPSDTVDWIVRQRQAAQASALTSLDDNPDDAARAYELSRNTGANPSLIYGDLDNAEQQTKAALTSAIIEKNSFLRSYITSHPLASKVSNDDWGQLDTVSGKLDRLHDGFFGNLINTPIDLVEKGLGSLSDNIAKWWVSQPTWLTQAINQSAEESKDFKTQGPKALLSPEAIDRTMNLAQGFGPADIAEAKEVAGAIEPWVKDGKIPPVGVHPAVDEVHKQQAKLDVQNLDEVFSEAQKSATRERSPELFADFIRQHTNASIGIDAEAVRKLYGDKVPEAGDNLLGWVTGIQDQLALAEAHGGDVTVPLADWLAKADPEVAKELHDSIRVRPDGMTLEETKAPEGVSMKAEGFNLLEDKGPVIDNPILGENTHKFEIQKDGQSVGKMHVFENDGGKTIHVQWIGGMPQEGREFTEAQLGPTMLRGILGELKNRFPNADKLQAERITGARQAAGTERLVTIPLKDQAVESLRRIAGLEPKGEPEGLPVRTSVPAEASEGGILPKEVDVKREQVKVDGQPLSPYANFPLREGIDQINSEGLNDLPRAMQMFMGHRLKALVGDVPVRLVQKDEMDAYGRKVHGAPVAGLYVPSRNEIYLSDEFASGEMGHELASEVLLHEGTHALTHRVIENDREIRNNVRALMGDAMARSNAALNSYGFTNEHEFMSEALNNPKFMSELHATPISEQTARRIGLGSAVKKTLADGFRRILKKIFAAAFKVPLGEIPESILDGVIHVQEKIEKALAEREINKDMGGKALPSKVPEQLGIKDMTRVEDRETFQKAAAIGMTKDQYTRYQALIEKRNAEDAERQAKIAQKRAAETQTKEWKENQAQVREQVREDLLARPDVAADRFLREGELYGEKVKKTKLDPSTLSPEQLAAIPKDYVGSGGIDASDAAGLFGYHSTDAMISQLSRLGQERELEGLTPQAHFTRMVDAETDRRMRAQYGSLDENILEEAKDHVISQTQLDMLHEEMLALATKNKGEVSLEKEQIKGWVKGEFDKTPLSGISSDKFLAAAGRAGTKAEKALLEEEPTDAFKAKQQQYLSLLLANEAKKLEKERASFDKIAKRFSKREVGGLPAEYTNWVHDILMRTGHIVRRSVQDLQREIAAQNQKTLEDFVRDRTVDPAIYGNDALSGATGSSMPVASFLFDPAYRKPIEQMTAEEFRAVANSVKTLVKNGRDENKVNVRGEKTDLANLTQRMAEQAERAMGTEHEYKFGDRSISVSNTLGAWALNVETWMNRLDLDNARGVFTQSIIRPISEGINNLAALEKQYAKEFRDLGDFGDMRQRIDNPLFVDPLSGKRLELTRENLLAILQNVGNPLQLRKLAAGYGTKPELVMQWLHQVTTKEDWDRAQGLGNLFEKIFDHSSNMYRELSGVAPARIELQPITTPFGEYPGWYHPLVPDPLRMPKGLKLDLMDENGYYQPMPSAGYTKGRTGAIYPILLNFDMVPFKIKTMLNDIAMRPAITDVAKIVRDSTFKSAFTKYMGKEFEKELVPWLRAAAGQREYLTPVQQTGLRLADFVRENIISNLIGLNPGTVMKHAPTAAFMSMREVGVQSFWREMFNLVGKDQETGERNWHFAMHGGNVDGFDWTGSEELQRRFRNWRETLSGSNLDAFQRKGNLMSLREAIQSIGAAPVAFSDLLSAVPTWLAKYHDLRAEGSSHGDAVFEADRAVRRAHGSSAVTNRPLAMRGGGLAQYLVPFYNFFNTVLNRQYELAWKSKLMLERRSLDGVEPIESGEIQVNPGQDWDREALEREYRGGASKIPHIMGGLFAYIIAPAIIEQLVSPVYTKKDSWTTTALKAVGYDLASSWPVLRDVVNAAMGGHDPSVGIYSTSVQTIANLIADAKKGRGATDRGHMGRTIRHFNDMFGLATGLTNDEIGKLSEYLYNVNKGVEHPRGAGDIYRGVRYGTQREFKR